MSKNEAEVLFVEQFPSNDARRAKRVFAMLKPEVMASGDEIADPVAYVNAELVPKLNEAEALAVQELLQTRGHASPTTGTNVPAAPAARAAGVSSTIVMPTPSIPHERRFLQFGGPGSAIAQEMPWGSTRWPDVRQAIVSVLHRVDDTDPDKQRAAIAELHRLEEFYSKNRFAQASYATAVLYIAAWKDGLYDTHEELFLRYFHED